MPKVLIIKMSSMGDILHTLPAITDAASNNNSIQLDWVVEKSFADIPRWHPAIHQVIPINWRRWRKTFYTSWKSGEFKLFWQQLRSEHYDLIIDAQGLLKSALVAQFARGKTAGFNFQSARESLASIFYQQRYAVNKNQHAISRLRILFSQALNYSLPTGAVNYGIDISQLPTTSFDIPEKSLLFVHGTTWDTKLWPENYWRELITQAEQSGYSVLLPWGNTVEKMRAERLASGHTATQVLPRLSISEIASVMIRCKGVVAVDTGLGHLAAALNIPSISLYGPTDTKKIGTLGENALNLSADFICAPCGQRICTYKKFSEEKPACFTTLPPKFVWEKLKIIIK